MPAPRQACRSSLKRVGRHRDDGRASVARQVPDLARGPDAVHFRHLHVHEDEVARRVRGHRQRGYAGLRDVDLQRHGFEQAPAHVLADRVVFGKKNPRAGVRALQQLLASIGRCRVGQAQAGATAAARGRVVGLREPGEQGGQPLRSQTDAGVADLEAHQHIAAGLFQQAGRQSGRTRVDALMAFETQPRRACLSRVTPPRSATGRSQARTESSPPRTRAAARCAAAVRISPRLRARRPSDHDAAACGASRPGPARASATTRPAPRWHPPRSRCSCCRVHVAAT